MKVFVVLLSISAVALASLEPAGYRPPGSSSQYIPPHYQSQHDHHQHQQHQLQHQHQQQQHQHQHQHQHQQQSSSMQYLPPNYNRQSNLAVKQPSQYLPPLRQQPQPSVPSSNYLPATEKPRIARPVQVANDYLPPTVPTTRPPPPAPVNDYLPPLSRAQSTSLPVKAPANDYLPAKRPVAPAPAPANDYLPPQASKPALKTAPVVPPKTEYLPARASAPSAPKSDYLPPAQHSTPSARISVVTASPYKLDGPAYAKQQPKFASSGLATAASSSSAKTGGYEYQQQPTDNYLPPNTGAGEFRSAAATAPAPAPTAAAVAPAAQQSGYQYEAASQNGYQYEAAAQDGYHYGVEQTTQPAKYDFEYRVSDEFGNDFSHQETREGAATHGSYTVLLPDGRKQTIQYDADENGFKPRISYEKVATVLGTKAALDGYDANANNLGPY